MQALAVAARLCGPELERYGRCVAASPGSWHRDCHQLSLRVTECTSSHPLVRRIRRDCSDSFGAFERCLRERPRGAAECGPHVGRFLLCAQGVAQGDTPTDTPGDTPRDTPGDAQGETPRDTTGDTPRDTPRNAQSATPMDTPRNTQSATPRNTPTVTPRNARSAAPMDTPIATPIATPTGNPWN
ncbi:coiled-coil-helix-coiled-coil-helix domain-containing protein 5 isoform X2 [Vidua chalybeata]|uniref:coiled-coil-helix-coiled-coil-helix domain-containing protein 5 isoform X2 n=1 Tax=Vidua chalybeata TaxID=81927 RepID=UPI0023A7CD97|nr:coiled-coil-helix-coiled-coil-helix domain-containing protein 5 isoform X2 [Vidua chalybeata]